MAIRASASRPSPKRVRVQPADLVLVRSARELATAADALRKRGCQLIAPATRVSHLAESFGVALTAIDVEPNPEAGQVYSDPTVMLPSQFALSRSTLQLISLAAGLTWLPSSRCTSDPAVKLLWQFRADAALTGYDGQQSVINGSAEVDLRDGSPQMGGWSPSKWRHLQLRQRAADEGEANQARADLPWTVNGWDEALVKRTRPFGLRLAETKAKSAAIRSLGLKSSYTVEELRHPFVVFRIVYVPDMSDREIRMAVHHQAMRSVATLYGASLQETPFAGVPVE